MQSSLYWSSTEYAPVPGAAWTFYTYVGYQVDNGKSTGLYAMAVRAGDVAPVPESDGLMLAALGMGLIGWQARRGDSARV